MSLIDFYKRLLESYGFFITEDDFVKIKPSNQTVLCAGRPLVLPTKAHIESCLITNDEGKIEIGKTLFNPITENSLKPENVSLTKLKVVNEITLSSYLFIAGQLLLILTNNKELQKKTGMVVNEFLVAASELKNPQVKELVDDKMIETWSKLYKKFSSEKDFVKIFIKKKGTKDGKQFNRLAVMSVPLYDELKKEKIDQIEGIKIRPREVKMFKLLIEFLIPEIKDKETVTYGSNDDKSPAFIALMILCLKQSKKLLEITETLKDLDQELYEKNINKFLVTEEDIFTASSVYKGELLLIPYDSDLLSPTVAKPEVPNVNINNAPVVPNANDGYVIVNGIRLPVVKEQPGSNNPVVNHQVVPNVIGTTIAPVVVGNLNQYQPAQQTVDTSIKKNIVSDFLIRSGVKQEPSSNYWGNVLSPNQKPANAWLSNGSINQNLNGINNYIPGGGYVQTQFNQAPNVITYGQTMQSRFN